MTIYRLALEAVDGFGSLVTNVMHFEQAELVSDESAEDLADEFATAVQATWQAIIGNGVTAKTIKVRNVADETDGHDLGINWVAARAGVALPPQVAGILRLSTGSFARTAKGSIKFYNPTETDNDAGQPNAGYRTGLENMGTILMGGGSPNLARYQLVVYSRKLLTARKVTSVVAAPLWGTVRSRKPGVGA